MGRVERKLKRNKKMIIWGIVALILVIIWGFYMVAQMPYRQAKSEAFQIAEKYANVDTIDNFYIYNRKHTYYTIEGKNKDHQEVYVVIPKKADRVDIYDKNKGITQEKAQQVVKQQLKSKTIIKTVFGMKDDKTPVWEVAYKNEQNNLCYAQVAFKDGKILQNITNM